MKKLFVGMTLLLALTGCGSNGSDSNKESSTSTSKVESTNTSSMVSKETVDSSKSGSNLSAQPVADTNKKIVEAFEKNKLPMFIAGNTGIHEPTEEEGHVLPEIPILSGLSFYTENVDSGFEYIIYVQTYSSLAELDQAFDALNQGISNSVLTYQVSKNDDILSVIFASDTMDSSTFSKYEKVFTSLK